MGRNKIFIKDSMITEKRKRAEERKTIHPFVKELEEALLNDIRLIF